MRRAQRKNSYLIFQVLIHSASVHLCESMFFYDELSIYYSLSPANNDQYRSKKIAVTIAYNNVIQRL